MYNLQSLQNKLLIATPDLTDPFFAHAVVYIYEHDCTGATGFIINKPLDIAIADMANHSALKSLALTAPILLGGPVKQEQVFLVLPDKIATPITSLAEQQAVFDGLSGANENNVMAFLGYASWTAGQLEHEISDNSWMIATASSDMLYRVPFSQRYNTAMAQIGCNQLHYIAQPGHA